MQKMMTDASGKEFPDLLDELVLSETGMNSSTYHQPLPDEKHTVAATAYRRDGTPVEGNWHIYPEMAAAGLWTTPADLLSYAIEVFNSYHGKSGRVPHGRTSASLFGERAPHARGFIPPVNTG